MRPSWLQLSLLSLVVGGGAAGRVKAAIFGSLLGGKSAGQPKHSDHSDAEQADLVAWLTEAGFAKYASKEWIDKLDDELAADSVSDMVDLLDDGDYAEVGMPEADAVAIAKAATREMLRRFLASVPPLEGTPDGRFVDSLDKLLASDYADPEDLADLEDDEGAELGFKPAETKHLVTWADEFEGREMLQYLFATYEPMHGGESPFGTEASWRPLLDALVKGGGVRNVVDLGRLSPSALPAEFAEGLARIQADKRVVSAMGKQEL